MRIDVVKVLFFGLMEQHDAFFSAAQKWGMIDFIEKRGRRYQEVAPPIEQTTRALKILKGLPTADQAEVPRHTTVSELIRQVIEHQESIEIFEEEHRKIQLEMNRVAIFGDFSLDDVEYIERNGDVCIQYFFAKKDSVRTIPEGIHLIPIGSRYNLDYFVGIHKEPVSPEKMVEIQIEHPIGALQKRKGAIEKELFSHEQHLKTYAQFADVFRRHLLELWDHQNLTFAKESAQPEMQQQLFAIEGWIPINKREELQTFADSQSVYVEEIAIEPIDRIPTYLENKGLGRVGEDVMMIYDTPSKEDKDPSLWVLWFFAFFFAFIINDGGYGMGFLALALFLRYKYPEWKGGARRFVRLLTLLSLFCIGWGILTTSFFGMQIDPGNPIRKLSLIDWLATKKVAYHMATKDATYSEWIAEYPKIVGIAEPNEFINEAYVETDRGIKTYDLLNQLHSSILLELALVTGIVHIFLSLLRYLRYHWAGIGWMLFLIGGYLYFPTYLGVVSLGNILFGIDPSWAALLGIECLAIGTVGACILSLIQHGFGGLFEITTVVQIFGDTLSYIRLYALGLAGGILSETINEMAGSVPLPFFVGGIIIFVGHGINVLLSIMGGVIHGLRLNFLEWYHYSFFGGGKTFQPLQLLEKE